MAEADNKTISSDMKLQAIATQPFKPSIIGTFKVAILSLSCAVAIYNRIIPDFVQSRNRFLGVRISQKKML